MAIAFDASASNSVFNGAEVTVSHTIGGGADRMVVTTISVEDTTDDPPTSVTYNGVAMTQQVASASGLCRTFVYTLPEASLPATGTYDVVVSASPQSWTHAAVFVYSYTGCSGTVEATASNQSDSAQSINASITTLTDGARIVGGAGHDAGTAISATSGQTNVLNITLGGTAAAGAGDEAIATAGAESFSWNSGSSGRDWGVAVIALEPAAAAGLNDPTGVTASNPTSSTIDLDWTDTNSATAFPRLYRRTPAGSGDWTFVEQLADASATSYTFTGLDPDTEYDLGVSYAD